MVKHQRLSHQFDDEPPLQVRFADENLRSDRQAENVALEMDVAGAHAILMNSPPHRANILSPKYNAVGVGVMQAVTGSTSPRTSRIACRTTPSRGRCSPAKSDYGLCELAWISGAGPQAPGCATSDGLRHGASSTPWTRVRRRSIAGVHRVVAWTATDLEQLPDSVKALLSQPLNSGYSLGVCFAASVSHPGGMYWIVMVAY